MVMADLRFARKTLWARDRLRAAPSRPRLALLPLLPPAALLIYAAWARGGTHVPLQPPLPWLGLAVLLGGLAGPARRERVARMLRDPLLPIGLLFLGLLLVQYWNSGRILVYDDMTRRWTYSPPPVAGLPSGFTRPESAEMLRWFFPAWTLVLALRAAVDGPRARALLWIMAANGALLALFGIGQYLSGTGTLLGLYPMNEHFFASFGYANHAGAFFTLVGAVSAGLLGRAVMAERGFHPGPVEGILTVMLLLNVAGACLSLSRIAIVLGLLGLIVASFFLLRHLWSVSLPAARVGVVTAILGFIFVAVFLVFAVGDRSVSDELGSLRLLVQRRFELTHRGEQVAAAGRMWRTAPWFGLGGWGFRYGAVTDARAAASPWWTSLGRANVHCDPIQFLVEFGAAGFGLLTLAVACLLAPVLRSKVWRLPLSGFCLLGLGMTFVHGLVDLPFRSPAITYHWSAILAILPRTTEES